MKNRTLRQDFQEAFTPGQKVFFYPGEGVRNGLAYSTRDVKQEGARTMKLVFRIRRQQQDGVTVALVWLIELCGGGTQQCRMQGLTTVAKAEEMALWLSLNGAVIEDDTDRIASVQGV